VRLEVISLQRSFDEIWIPRIGEKATAQLRRNGYLTLVVGPTILALAIGSSFAFGSGVPAGWLLGGVCVAVALAAFVAWMRSRLKLAKALSEWFGVGIGWQEVPRMRAAQFDTWCQRRGLRKHTP
jgi:hypothetical protein